MIMRYVPLIVLLILLLLPLGGVRYWMDFVTEVMIYSLFALSLNVLVGYTNDLSFGHAAFFAVGGYGGAILLNDMHWPIFAALPASMALAGGFALLVGAVCLRLSDIYFAILTLAFSMLVWSLAVKWVWLTGGDDGYVGIVLPRWLQNPQALYYFLLLTFVAAVTLLWRVMHSPFGQSLQAIRDNPLRVRFLAIPRTALRLAAFVLAGSFAGLAGMMLALQQRAMFTESAFWTQSGQVLIMVLLGGRSRFWGPVFGACVLYGLEVTLGQWTGYWQVVLGGILLLLVLVVPEGLIGVPQRIKALGQRHA